MATNTVQPEHLSLIVSKDRANERLDVIITKNCPHYSRSYFQQLIEEGLVSVNDKVIKKNSYPVKEGDSIIVQFPPKREIAFVPEEIKLPIEKVFENNHFIIINKPAGLLVHPPHLQSREVSLVDWLLYEYKELQKIGTADRPGIIHRLDKDTSGLIIIPRTNYAYMYFGNLFRNREIHKTYLAVVSGHPAPKGIIDFAIGRDPITKHRMATAAYDPVHLPRGFRTALTHYHVLEYFDDAALVEIKPLTGRTHQIRVHFAAIGHPIIGDKLYGQPSKLINRQALHAAALDFEFDEKPYHFYQKPPQDFLSLCQAFRTQKK